MTPKFKSETTRLCVALLTIKQELAGGGVHIPYGEGGVRCAAAPRCSNLIAKDGSVGRGAVAGLKGSLSDEAF